MTQADLSKPEFAAVQLCAFPYPYRAMFTICNDLDDTPDWEVYLDIMRYLNTAAPTSMGRGVDLEIANSLFFWPTYNPCREFTYWDTSDQGRAMAIALMHSGHIDTLHSFGHLARTRDHAAKALDELRRHDCALRVWVDHASAPHNFGPDIMHGHGDDPEATAYHADLTVAYGIEYVWRGRVTGIIGQNVPPRLSGLFMARHPVRSGKTVGKEVVKRLFSGLGVKRYPMHRANRLLRVDHLRDGQPIYEFLRSNPCWRGVECCATAGGMAEVLTDTMLDRLIARRGVCVLYTHFGKVHSTSCPFDDATRSAIERVAQRYDDKQLLVTTTARLLDYVRVRETLRWSTHREHGEQLITIRGLEDPIRGYRTPSTDALSGITFQMDGDQQARIVNAEGKTLESRTCTDGGQTWVSLPWARLGFPDI